MPGVLGSAGLGATCCAGISCSSCKASIQWCPDSHASIREPYTTTLTQPRECARLQDTSAQTRAEVVSPGPGAFFLSLASVSNSPSCRHLSKAGSDFRRLKSARCRLCQRPASVQAAIVAAYVTLGARTRLHSLDMSRHSSA